MRILCPAKINLFLSVGPRDARGYHPLRTIFQAVSLYDTLDIERGETNSFEWTSEDDLDLPADNTVTKAWRHVAEVAQLPPLRVKLTKSIPAQSGLGGGSSDAAGFLKAINQLLPAPLTRETLADIAFAVGSDVPFFLRGGRAKGEGYGEQLVSCSPQPAWYLIARPNVDCPTAEMYRKLDEIDYPWRPFPEDDELYNDFERVAPCECLELTERLRIHGAKGALLTGSGSAVFGLFETKTQAELATSALLGETGGRLKCWVCESLPTS